MIDNEYSPILHYFYCLILFVVLEFILQKKVADCIGDKCRFTIVKNGY
jgi:hypothetical protein